jgi:hypothetical protein
MGNPLDSGMMAERYAKERPPEHEARYLDPAVLAREAYVRSMMTVTYVAAAVRCCGETVGAERREGKRGIEFRGHFSRLERM